jgi:membrane-bound serine protease (ClpP class)
VPEGGMFPDTPQAQNDLLYGALTLILSVATAGVGIYFLSKHLGSLPLFGSMVLQAPRPDDEESDEMLAAMAPEPSGPVRPGMRGRAVTPLRPSGRVEIEDRIVDAVSELGYIPAGSEVVVTSVTPFRITVERVAGTV